MPSYVAFIKRWFLTVEIYIVVFLNMEYRILIIHFMLGSSSDLAPDDIIKYAMVNCFIYFLFELLVL